MTHDEMAELLGAYALDALEDDERALVEEHLPQCAKCRAEVTDHREVAALLGNGGADAPEGLWDRIAGTLESAPPRLDLAPVLGLAAARSRSRSRWIPSRTGAALAAAAAVLIAFLGIQVRDDGARIDEMQTALSDPLSRAFDAAVADPKADRFQLTSTDGTRRILAVVAEDGVGYIRASNLPDLQEGFTYQLWGASEDRTVSLGIIGRAPGVVSFAAGHRFYGFAITAEKEPGVERTDRSPVVAGTLS